MSAASLLAAYRQPAILDSAKPGFRASDFLDGGAHTLFDELVNIAPIRYSATNSPPSTVTRPTDKPPQANNSNNSMPGERFGRGKPSARHDPRGALLLSLRYQPVTHLTRASFEQETAAATRRTPRLAPPANRASKPEPTTRAVTSPGAETSGIPADVVYVGLL